MSRLEQQSRVLARWWRMRFKGREKARPFSVFLCWRSDSSDFQILENPLHKITASVTHGILMPSVFVNRILQYNPRCFFKYLSLVWLCRVSFAACGVFPAAQSAQAQQLWPRASLLHHTRGRGFPTRDRTRASFTARQFLTTGPPGKSLSVPC